MSLFCYSKYMKVIVGVGVPGCGKTTYLKPLAEELKLEYINPDDIRQEITGDATNHSEEVQVWDTVHSRLAESLKNNGAVVDATYTKIKDRRQLLEICQQNGTTEIVAYWFNAPLETCIKRNSQRERAVPEKAIKKMYNRLKLNPPTQAEGFSEVVEIKDY
jgi:predicted kinase